MQHIDLMIKTKRRRRRELLTCYEMRKYLLGQRMLGLQRKKMSEKFKARTKACCVAISSQVNHLVIMKGGLRLYFSFRYLSKKKFYGQD